MRETKRPFQPLPAPTSEEDSLLKKLRADGSPYLTYSPFAHFEKKLQITGELVQIGEDETGFCRAIVKLDRATLRTIERLPMYRPVQIVECYDPIKDQAP